MTKENYDKYSYFSFLIICLFHALLLPVLIINYLSNKINLNNISNLLSCEIYTNQITNVLKTDYQIIKKSISFIPEIKNIACLNKVTNIEFLNDYALIETVTSYRFIGYIQSIIFSLLFVFIYLAKDKLNKNLIYLNLFSVLLVQELFFSFTIYNYKFIFVFLFKLFLLIGLIKATLNYEIKDLEIFTYIFLISFSFINIEFLINKDEIFYFGNALYGNNELSSHSTTVHALAYNSIIRFLFPIFNIKLKIFLDIVLSLWFSFICYKFGKLYKFQYIYL